MIYHNMPDYLLDPQHKVTVCVIGCGGTGSQVLSVLARMNVALIGLGHIGLHVVAYDDDKVSKANIGRQLFSENEIGSYKCISLITRLNRFYGTNWEGITEQFNDSVKETYNIYITCVDSFEARIQIGKQLRSTKLDRWHDKRGYYWLDFGNTNNTGQAILGTLDKEMEVQLPCFDEWAKKYKKPRKSQNTPSCSLAEALEKQDLLINSSLANAGMQLLWRLFREGKTPYRGVIINLDSLISNPIRV